MKTKPKRRPWTKSDIRTLKAKAHKEPVPRIAKSLKRTPGAVRQKAFDLGQSLRYAA